MRTIIIIFSIIALFLLIFGCTETESTSELKEKVDSLEIANNKIIELQENEKYIETQIEKVKSEKDDLQIYYNKLFNDAVACYWANECLYYGTSCEEHFSEFDMSAKEIHIFQSNECEMMIRDWEEYLKRDTG